MKFILYFLLLTTTALGQQTIGVGVRHADTKQPIAGATVRVVGGNTGSITDSTGFARISVPNTGPVRLKISAVGFETAAETVMLPSVDTLQIALKPAEEELDEVTVTTTRTGRTVADEPTRVEVIDGEELDEKANMQPGNISMILRESTGIQVQQTSVMSANATIRIQGLDGRYTQLLQDGLPLYSGFSSGLSIMQIPPLNLRQVEVLKGCQSTLYGSGAIAGLVNLVTKDPTRERELSFMGNGTSAGGLDLNGYYAHRNEKIGLTLYATRNTQRAFDPNRDNFSDLPQTSRTTVQPKLFWYPTETTTVSAGLIWVGEDRTGGYMPTLRTENTAGFTEENQSNRLATQFRLDSRFRNDWSLTVKNSYSTFRRTITQPIQNYRFDGVQQSSFSEVSAFRHRPKTDWIVGLNVWTDAFRQPVSAGNQMIYNQLTAGLFVQNTLMLSEQFSLETGLRTDWVQTRIDATGRTSARLLALPRFSLLYRASERWTSRLGGGLGYKAPTIFTEDAERLSFRNVDLTSMSTGVEQSLGLNWDVNYRTELGDETTLSINQLFFATRLNNPLVLSTMPGESTPGSALLSFQTANGFLFTRGLETNIRLVHKAIHGFLGYSLIDTHRRYDNLTGPIPLTARHRLYLTTLYETERVKTGFEVFYTGQQQRSDGSSTRSYVTMGYMAEWKWVIANVLKGSLFINFENFTDVRQSRFEPLVSGSALQPVFVTDIYAPTDGRIINGGLKLRL
ncbi:TonB-dependent receptor [Spirosoma montaniterrae]|uniref:TonB-dependent receptor n=1 Tax=Spirosoma montaniterrae TaxID=1178516 RepID=A0A1P9WWQ8_9BACT|nr:TonB-dependent receptor [Spirosoma montaniterrae]AQG79814.1 hypothetical protein AWR27_11055 [Spirosoma montaniterrae]